MLRSSACAGGRCVGSARARRRGRDRLADGDIEVAAAQARLAGQQLDIEGAEEHGADRTERLTGLAGDAVDADALARERGAGQSRGAVGSGRDHDFDRDGALPRFGVADEPHELWGGCVPGDQLAFAGGAQRAERGEHPTRFDEVRLAGGVGAADEVEAAFERQIERRQERNWSSRSRVRCTERVYARAAADDRFGCDGLVP